MRNYGMYKTIRNVTDPGRFEPSPFLVVLFLGAGEQFLPKYICRAYRSPYMGFGESGVRDTVTKVNLMSRNNRLPVAFRYTPETITH